MRRICSDISDFDKHATYLAEKFLKRGYPIKVIDEALIKPVDRTETPYYTHPPKIQNRKTKESL